MHLGIDARPLAYPATGIGRYTREIIHQISIQTDWALTLFCIRDNVVTESRALVVPVSPICKSNTAAFQLKLAALAKQRRLSCFFSPRHHLPLGLNIPTVVTIHDLVWLTAPETMRQGGRLAERLLMPRAIDIASQIIAVSHSTQRDVVTHFPTASGKIQVIHEAAFATRTNSSPSPLQEPYILAVGTQEPRKNYERLLLAFQHVRTRHPLKLVITGGPGWKTNLSDNIERLGLANSVDLCGDVGDAELAALYTHCEFLVMPSIYEGFGLALVEAMGFGKALVTSNNSAMPEIAGDAAVLVDPYDVSSIAQGMLRVIEDNPLRQKLEANSRLQASKYSWYEAGAQTIKVIEKASTSAPN